MNSKELVFDALVEFNGRRETRMDTTLDAINSMLKDTVRYRVLEITLKPYTRSSLARMVRQCGALD
jgi:hypothetical protein